MPGGPHACLQYRRDPQKPRPVTAIKDPNDLNQRAGYRDFPSGPNFRDDYVYIEPNPAKPQGNYDSGYPYHGGVSYGPSLGTVSKPSTCIHCDQVLKYTLQPGFYPDLNRKAAREVWGQQYQDLFSSGLEFVWQDMTTPAVADCYGDMLGYVTCNIYLFSKHVSNYLARFPSRLLISDDPYAQDATKRPSAKTAIELWGLYSYNLHKATYHGLNRLKGRENKRNFIIGRGSQTGMHRYAGLWTGDNGSSWDFWRISVAQVLALGYSGMSIAGSDMGGFTGDPAAHLELPRWCDPELLVRWYAGAFLLPWYRNHYMAHTEIKEMTLSKSFQVTTFQS
jgi:hypothetical protein